MSSMALVEGPSGVVAAWDTDGQIYFAGIKPGTIDVTQPRSAPGSGRDRKHPALAVNARGETILVWTEGTGWQKGGALSWQVYDKNGKPVGEMGAAQGVPVWGLATVVAEADGKFSVIY